MLESPTPPTRPHRPASRIGVARIDGAFRVIATAPIGPDEIILRVFGRETPLPSRFSVQVAADTHVDVGTSSDLESDIDSHPWRFLNHHCEPNSALRGRVLVALRRIDPWEEVSFNYNSTEYKMAAPFQCCCGSRRCDGWIRGFHQLNADAQRRLLPLLADHLVETLGRPE